MFVVSKRIPSGIFDQARRVAAQERAKAEIAFFAAIGRHLRALLHPRRTPAEVHFRFHHRGLWRGI